MTRDFNKQRRDDERPSFREQSSNNHGDERPSPSARPRLNRETVDRAWESGAQQKHADYRARSNNGQPPRNNWRNQQPSGYSSSQNGHGGNRPYSNPQESHRDNSRGFERTSDNFNGPRSPRAQSFGPNTIDRQHSSNARPGERPHYTGRPTGERRPYDNQRPDERSHYNNARPAGERRPYDNQRPGERPHYTGRPAGEQRPYDNQRPGERSYGPGARPDYRRDVNRPGNRDERFHGQERDRDNRRPNFERNERPYPNERRGPGGPYNQRSGPDSRNPRWQSRTWTRQASPEERQEHSSRASKDEQFEGDYERFNDEGRPRDTAFRGKPRREYEKEEPVQERHVTPLPDGRVLKGPRPVQRQQARFWSEVANDTEGLIGHIPAEQKEAETAQPIEGVETANAQVDATVPATEDKPSKKPRTRSASATVRSRKAGETKEKTRGPKGPRPSQRGFKWPTT